MDLKRFRAALEKERVLENKRLMTHRNVQPELPLPPPLVDGMDVTLPPAFDSMAQPMDQSVLGSSDVSNDSKPSFDVNDVSTYPEMAYNESLSGNGSETCRHSEDHFLPLSLLKMRETEDFFRRLLSERYVVYISDQEEEKRELQTIQQHLDLVLEYTFHPDFEADFEPLAKNLDLLYALAFKQLPLTWVDAIADLSLKLVEQVISKTFRTRESNQGQFIGRKFGIIVNLASGYYYPHGVSRTGSLIAEKLFECIDSVTQTLGGQTWEEVESNIFYTVFFAVDAFNCLLGSWTDFYAQRPEDLDQNQDLEVIERVEKMSQRLEESTSLVYEKMSLYNDLLLRSIKSCEHFIQTVANNQVVEQF